MAANEEERNRLGKRRPGPLLFCVCAYLQTSPRQVSAFRGSFGAGRWFKRQGGRGESGSEAKGSAQVAVGSAGGARL